MQLDAELTRRTVLRTTAIASGSLLLAGCLGESSESEPAKSDSASSQKDNTSQAASKFGDWFDNVPNYDSIVDETGKSEITVTVGADANNGFTFTPPAIKISTGTTVVWKWSGKGGSHNVVEADGVFESEMSGEKGHTFEHTFDEVGTYRYYCEPHRSTGMKGGILVE
ncbi:halocyanin domain-containing protein [Halomicrococcus sp. SG-WS-1]|uniref:halocyanin domain-containing protein n=1 Tax=Halomicrococcus sp. SG-WS-1 TaxID=3439057 RepID=UPI003F78FE65